MQRKALTTIFIILTALVLVSCNRSDTESQSMEQIYSEQGIPVTVETVAARPFTTENTYHQTLTGIRQSNASASVADKVDKILYHVGDRVEKDAVVITFPTNNPAAQYHQAKVGFEHAETTLKRMQNLYDNGGISLQDLDNTKTQYEVAKANWEAVRQTIKVLAPISGTITGIHVMESDNVHPGDVLFTVSQTYKLKSQLWIAESQALAVKNGDRAIARWNGITLEGKVVRVDLSMSAQNQAFGVAVEFDNPGSRVPSGVNAEIQLLSGSGDETILIERKNVITEGQRSFVYVANGQTAQKRPVTLGRERDLDVEILSGLKDGDRIISGSKHLLEDGVKIRIQD